LGFAQLSEAGKLQSLIDWHFLGRGKANTERLHRELQWSMRNRLRVIGRHFRWIEIWFAAALIIVLLTLREACKRSF
jgi:hypothetical protein